MITNKIISKMVLDCKKIRVPFFEGKKLLKIIARSILFNHHREILASFKNDAKEVSPVHLKLKKLYFNIDIKIANTHIPPIT